MNALRWMAGVIFAACFVAFAVANAHLAPINWSPFHGPADVPLSLVALAALIAGFVMGAGAVWINYAPLRRERRVQKRQIQALEQQIEQQLTAANENRGGPEAPPAARWSGS